MRTSSQTNIVVFLLFFGIALIEALQKGNWLEAWLFIALGLLFLRADFKGDGHDEKIPWRNG